MTKEFKPMKQTIMISQPMKDLSSEKIIEARKKAINTLETFGYDVIDNFFTDYTDDGYIAEDTKHKPVAYLAKSIEKMSKCDAVYFIKDGKQLGDAKLNTKSRKLTV